MSNVTDQWRRRLKRRYRAEQRFKTYAVSALVVACAFLVFFFADIISKGYTAFVQAQLQMDIAYSEDARDLPVMAVDEAYELLISRGFLRLIPRQMEGDPDLVGTTRRQWVLASADVDQYLKGKPNRLDEEERTIVDRLKDQGRARLAPNFGFLIHGDSKLPEMAGIRAAVVGSLLVLLITMLCSVPVGVMTSVYLEEFAPDNKLTRLIEVNINNLAAIPSILFGLLGLAIFINVLGAPRSSALAGGLTLGLVMLPIVIISTRAALRAVPDGIREGAYAVGASPWQTIQHHVLPLSLPGILTGSIIGLARAMGETAPLLIIGMFAYIPAAPTGLTDAATVLPVQIYTWFAESQRAFNERAAAGILVLLAVLMLLNATAVWLRNKYEKRW